MAFNAKTLTPRPWPRCNSAGLITAASSPFSVMIGKKSKPIFSFNLRLRFNSPINCKFSKENEDDYLIDAPVSVGDGFSFSGGKYSDGPNPSDEWFKQGKMVNAHPVGGSGEKAKDPIFGLKMGSSSQALANVFRLPILLELEYQ